MIVAKPLMFIKAELCVRVRRILVAGGIQATACNAAFFNVLHRLGYTRKKASRVNDPRIAGLLRNAGHILIHQPAYSPRFQPAEHWFSCLRHEMQLHNDEYLALGEQWRPGPLALYIFSDEPRANATLYGDDSPLWLHSLTITSL